MFILDYEMLNRADDESLLKCKESVEKTHEVS